MTLLLTSLLISIIASLGVWLMGRKDPCGKPWLTAVCLVVLLVLPLLTFLPKVQLEVLQAADVSSSAGTSLNWIFILGICWLVVSLILGLRLVWSQVRLKEWLGDTVEADFQNLVRECASMLGVKKLPQVRLKRGLTTPVVSGLWRPVIVLPTSALDWNQETQKMAILHEMGHVLRRDLWVRIAAEFACVLHWYNPLVWWLRAKMLSQCEYACDAMVVSAGADKGRYIHALCDVIESALNEPRPREVLAMADHAPLKLRVSRLLGGARGGKSWVAIVAATMTICTALGFSLVRPAMVIKQIDPPTAVYNQEEIDLRHNANPFPGN